MRHDEEEGSEEEEDAVADAATDRLRGSAKRTPAAVREPANAISSAMVVRSERWKSKKARRIGSDSRASPCVKRTKAESESKSKISTASGVRQMQTQAEADADADPTARLSVPQAPRQAKPGREAAAARQGAARGGCEREQGQAKLGLGRRVGFGLMELCGA